MKDTQRINGTVSYHDIGLGVWGITDTKGNDWMPVNMPDQLKVSGAKVRCTIRVLKDVATAAMWGTPVKVISFQTPNI